MKFLQGFLLIFLVVISNVQGQTYTEWTAFGDCTETCNINSPYRTRTRTCTPAVQCQNAILNDTVACNREYPCPEFEEHFYTGEVLKYNKITTLREIKETFQISFKAVLTNKIRDGIICGFFDPYNARNIFIFELDNGFHGEYGLLTNYYIYWIGSSFSESKQNEVNASNKWSNITLSQLKINSTYFIQLKVNDEIVWNNEALEPQISINTTVYFEILYYGPDSSNYIKDIYIATGRMISFNYTEWTAFSDCTATCNINRPIRTRTRTCTPEVQCQNAISTDTVACNREYPCPEFEEHFYTGEVSKYYSNHIATLREIKETFLISFKAVTYKIEEGISGYLYKSYNEIYFFGFKVENVLVGELGILTTYDIYLNGAYFFEIKHNEVNAFKKWSNITVSQLKTNSTYFLQLKVNDEIVWNNEALEPQISINTTVYFDIIYNAPDSTYIKDIYIATGKMTQGQTYTEWTAFGDCTETCDINSPYRTRTRTCTPAVQCQNAISTYSVACNREYPCPEAGTFSSWSNWLACSSRSSGPGITYRFRTCLPVYGSCIGDFSETQVCVFSPVKCSDTIFIFVFVLDSSSTVDDQGWADKKKLVLSFLKSSLFGVNLNVDVAVVNFGTTSQIEADCGIYKNLSSFTIFMNNLARINGGTAIHKGLLNAEIALQRCLKLNAYPVIILLTGGSENVDTDIDKNIIIENRIKQKALVVAGYIYRNYEYSDGNEIERITGYDNIHKGKLLKDYMTYRIYEHNFTSLSDTLYPFVLESSECEAGTFSAWASWNACMLSSRDPSRDPSRDLGLTFRTRICLPSNESCNGNFHELQYCIFSPVKCSDINFIFVFVLDSSSIVDDQGWADEKKLVLSFLKSSSFGVNLNVDVAVVNFGATSQIEADCGIYKNLSSFTIFMNNLPRINGGTAIHKGLRNAEIALQRCLKLNSYPFIILLTGGFENVDTDIKENIIIEDRIKQIALVIAGATHKYNKGEIDRITYDNIREEYNVSYDIFADNFTYLYSRFANRLYRFVLEITECHEYCSPESVGDINFTGVYYFPNTAVNGISSLRCVYNTSIVIQRRCIYNSITGANEWDFFDSSVCPAKSQTTQQLSDLNKVIITASTVELTAFSLSKIVQVGSLSTYDISLISNIITSLINANNSSFEVTNHIISTVDTVLSNPVLSVAANKQYNVSSNFMYQLDLLGNQQTGNITISRKNLALASYSIETNQNPVFIYSTLNQNNLTVKILSENKTSVLQNIKAYIILPQELFIGQNKTQVYSYVFLEKSVLFAGPSNKINSIILSATINGQNVKNSPYPISMMFLRENNDSGNRTCQFYTQDQVWSTNGCNTSSNSSEKVMCQCDHLTNFALIIDTDQTGNNPLSLQIITWIGCGISIAGLFITILSHLIFPKIFLYLSSKILLNLCVSLMITLIIFLSLVQKTEPRLLCQIVASLLQFFILSTFFWMAVEGINLYISLVKVFRGSYSSSLFMLKSCAFAWGVPLIATVVTAAINRDNLGPLTEKDPKICVVRGLSFYFGVLLPLCIVVVVNIIFIFLVLKGVGANYNFGPNSSASNINDIKKKARIALGCSLLLGTTWIFAILAVGDLRDVFQWLFCIFNSLQGFFIFIFYVVQNKDVRNQWHLLLKKKIAAKDVVTLSDITNQNRTR